MNFYIMIFLTISLMHCLYLYDYNEKNLILKYKFSISSFIFLFLTVILGLRHAIGSDYGGYMFDFIYMRNNFYNFEILQSQSLDLFYEYLSFFVIFLDLPFEVLNLLVSSILILSLIFFANQEKDYLLIILIFLSYYYLVLGMGYVRQGLSLSFLLIFIHLWRNEKNLLSWVFLLLAVLSHKFAIISAFLVFVRPRGKWFYFNKYFYIFSLLILSYLLFKIFEQKSIDEYFKAYSLEYSRGALYRTLAGVVCALLFFSKKSFFKKRSDYRYIYLSSIILLFLFPLSFLYSTVSDRIMSYFLPCIFIILCVIPNAFTKIKPQFLKFGLIIILFSHLFIWTNFSRQSYLYVPYKMIDYPGAIESAYGFETWGWGKAHMR